MDIGLFLKKTTHAGVERRTACGQKQVMAVISRSLEAAALRAPAVLGPAIIGW